MEAWHLWAFQTQHLSFPTAPARRDDQAPPSAEWRDVLCPDSSHAARPQAKPSPLFRHRAQSCRWRAAPAPRPRSCRRPRHRDCRSRPRSPRRRRRGRAPASGAWNPLWHRADRSAPFGSGQIERVTLDKLVMQRHTGQVGANHGEVNRCHHDSPRRQQPRPVESSTIHGQCVKVHPRDSLHTLRS